MDRSFKLVLASTVTMILLGSVIHYWPDRNTVSSTDLASKKIEEPIARSPQNQPSMSDRLSKISETEACYQSFTCDFPQSDPRAYDIAVGKELAKNIQQLHKDYAGNPKTEGLLKEIGIKYFKSENGFVQEAALSILKDFDPDPEILQSLIEGLENTYNPRITEQSLPFLEKYLGSESEPQVHSLLEKLMLGAHFSGETTSTNILSFINEKSYGFYVNLLKALPVGSKNHQNLKSALSEYEKRQSGG